VASLLDRRGEQIAVDVSAAPAMRTRVVRATTRLVPMKRHWPQRRESSSPADKSKTTPQPKQASGGRRVRFPRPLDAAGQRRTS
jgi:hypothetical protein